MRAFDCDWNRLITFVFFTFKRWIYTTLCLIYLQLSFSDNSSVETISIGMVFISGEWFLHLVATPNSAKIITVCQNLFGRRFIVVPELDNNFRLLRSCRVLNLDWCFYHWLMVRRLMLLLEHILDRAVFIFLSVLLPRFNNIHISTPHISLDVRSLLWQCFWLLCIGVNFVNYNWQKHGLGMRVGKPISH